VAPKSGGTASEFTSTEEGARAPVGGIAVDDVNVYVTDPYAGTVNAASKADQSYTVLYQYGPGTAVDTTFNDAGVLSPFDVAVSGGVVYWSAQGGALSFLTNGIVGGQVGVDGGNPIDYAVDDEGLSTPELLAADSTGAYIVMNGSGIVTPIVYNGAATGGASFLGGGTYGIALDSSYAYWSGAYTGTGSVGRTARDGGSPLVLANNLGKPMGIAVDSNYIYWVDNSAGTVNRIALGGGSPTTLAQSQNHPWGIAVDDTGIYWTNNGSGTVMVLAK
jgi:hypothetical protein